jgi:hypothetical protein
MNPLKRVNVPLYAINTYTIAEYLSGSLRVILDENHPGPSDDLMARSRLDPDMPGISLICQAKDYSDPGSEYVQGYYREGVYICHKWFHQGKNFDWLESPLPEQLYCAGSGFRECLPGNPFQFTDYKSAPEILPVGVPKHIRTWMHLFSSLHWFRRTDAEFSYLSESQAAANLYRAIKQYKIFRVVGDDGSRIADLSRLLLAVIGDLLPYLSPEMRSVISPILPNVPDTSTVVKLIDREQQIQQILQKFNENT